MRGGSEKGAKVVRALAPGPAHAKPEHEDAKIIESSEAEVIRDENTCVQEGKILGKDEKVVMVPIVLEIYVKDPEGHIHKCGAVFGYDWVLDRSKGQRSKGDEETDFEVEEVNIFINIVLDQSVYK